jgi:hypothetical protein
MLVNTTRIVQVVDQQSAGDVADRHGDALVRSPASGHGERSGDDHHRLAPTLLDAAGLAARLDYPPVDPMTSVCC